VNNSRVDVRKMRLKMLYTQAIARNSMWLANNEAVVAKVKAQNEEYRRRLAALSE